jgi:nitrous oxide reductase accessory protein NosL
MIISDPRFAAGLAYEVEPGRYQSLAFDDIGELLVYAGKHPELHAVAWYVHDYASEEWIDATLASYVAAASIQTPMGFGIAAHKEHAAAEAMAAQIGAAAMNWQSMHTYLAEHNADHRSMNDTHSNAAPDAHPDTHAEPHAKSDP